MQVENVWQRVATGHPCQRLVYVCVFAFNQYARHTFRQNYESFSKESCSIWRMLWTGTFLSKGWDAFAFEKQALTEVNAPKFNIYYV